MAMRVRIIGADSIGSRSMATVVEANGVKIFIDPGVSYAPRRYGLPPHPVELQRLREIKERILDEITDADIIVITHYHYDHYLREPEEANYYRDKVLLVKDPTRDINFSQKMRAYRLFKRNAVEELARSIHVLDGRVYEIAPGVVVHASPPVPHGSPGTKLGYVVMVAIECCNEVFVHASDVQGPMSDEALNWLLSVKPSLVFISGPPTYFAGYKVPREEVDKGLHNLKVLAEKLPRGSIIVADHHMARDLEYPNYLVRIASETNARITSAAEFMGLPYEPLEALRKQLWRRGGSDAEAAYSDRAP